MDKLKRLETGIAGLDALLKGGLVAGASYIVQGRPGSGKTILANQLGFNHARQGGRVLVVTLLSESHERLFQYLSTLSFFEPARIGNEIQFVSAFDTLENEGLDEVVKLLRREISRQKATVLIVDGLLNARSKADSQIDTKKFISELQGHAAFAGCTVLFLTSARLDDGSPEHTMVDGVIEMGEELFGTRSVRRIQMRKTRGSGALSGLHECEINDDGLVIHPRLEALFPHFISHDHYDPKRVSSGVPALDELIGGGLPQASATLLMGPSGVGKTTLGIHFLGAATPEAPALHFGFYEGPERLTAKAKALGVDFEALQQSGALFVEWQPITQGMMDGLGARLLALVERHGIRRVLIDSLGGLTRTNGNPARLGDYFSALVSELRARGVTVVGTYELRGLFGPEVSSPLPDLSSIVDNVVVMRFVEHVSELKRCLTILKIRDSDYDASLRELVIGGQGVELKKAFTQAEAVLTGSASTTESR
ncbi:ATPase domain-containing protein [Pseudomonas sp. NPDC007930]|uniref:ATPase domain-containing protein n=1 Tax=Pseudomonas sp. NPDC007930 TaxID=3364417 RepID=UPI0036F02208